jgi:hypothetical protein
MKNIICILLGHKTIFKKCNPSDENDQSGYEYCKRCKSITGGIGNITIVLTGGGGSGGVYAAGGDGAMGIAINGEDGKGARGGKGGSAFVKGSGVAIGGKGGDSL